MHIKDQSNRSSISTSTTLSNSHRLSEVPNQQHLPSPEVPSDISPTNPQSYYNIPPSPLISPLPTQVVNTQESTQGTNSEVANSQLATQIPSQVVNASALTTSQTATPIASPVNSPIVSQNASQIKSSDYYAQPLPPHASQGYSQPPPSQQHYAHSREQSGAHEIIFPQNNVTSSQQHHHNHGRVTSIGSSDKYLPPPSI